jgi:Fur family ferric uptake transcriptional regulator
VLDTFLKTEDHLSVEDLYRLVNKKGRVGYATVHRTMKLITECGLAREVMFDDGICRFEHSHRHEHHHHLVCTHCRKVIEFTSDVIDRGEEAVLKKYGFKMESHQYKVFGICGECQREMNNGGNGRKGRQETSNGRQRKQAQSR